MSIIDYIKQLIGNNKKTPQIIVKNLTKTYMTKDQLEIGLYHNKNPITDATIDITINGVTYERTTDNDGIARLNINLNVGEYNCYIDYNETKEYNPTNAYTKVIVKGNTRMEGTNITKKASETSVYQCAIYDQQNTRLTQTPVDITVNGVTYNKTTETDGLAKLNIRLNQIGNYTITAQYNGDKLHNSSQITNTITIQEDPKPTPQPVKLNPYMTSQGCSGMGQCTGYYCACNSLQQCIYRLTGEKVSESTLASVMGTTTNGTSHEGIQTGVAWFNRKYGYNLKITWKNFSEVGYGKLQEYINNGAVFFHLLYKDRYGHYEVPKEVSGSNIIILNSLGNSCGNGTYCGYIETRSQSTQTRYINGISQKSVCIITR